MPAAGTAFYFIFEGQHHRTDFLVATAFFSHHGLVDFLKFFSPDNDHATFLGIFLRTKTNPFPPLTVSSVFDTIPTNKQKKSKRFRYFDASIYIGTLVQCQHKERGCQGMEDKTRWTRICRTFANSITKKLSIRHLQHGPFKRFISSCPGTRRTVSRRQPFHRCARPESEGHSNSTYIRYNPVRTAPTFLGINYLKLEGLIVAVVQGLRVRQGESPARVVCQHNRSSRSTDRLSRCGSPSTQEPNTQTNHERRDSGSRQSYTVCLSRLLNMPFISLPTNPTLHRTLLPGMP